MSFKDNRLVKLIKLSREAFSGFKKQIIVLTILGFISGFLEGIGVNALIPMFSFVVNSADKGTDFISEAIHKLFIFLHIPFTLKYLLIFITSLFIFKACLVLLISYLSIKIVAGYGLDAKERLFSKTLNANWPYLSKQKLGHLETIIQTDIKNSATLLRQIVNIIIIFTGLLMYVVIAVNISFYITLVTLILGLIIFLIFKPLIYRTRVVSGIITNLNKDIAHFVAENIFGIKAVKASMVKDNVIKSARKYFNKMKDLQIRINILKSLTTSFIQPISIIFICVIFAVWYKTAYFNFAALIAIVYLIQRIFQYLQQSQATLQLINESIPYLQSVISYEKAAEENQEIINAKQPFVFNNSLKLNNTSFSYADRPDRILKNLTLEINKGEMIGLIGPSGAGKTTLVDIILRLLDPTSGEILLDNINAKEISIADWRAKVGYVSQDIFLMNDTVANNIKFYNELSKKELEEAAKKANIYDFIQGLPDKFNTVIGERGIMLSAGQRQRVIIARVLARKPELLILDEATSALDNESELKIQKVIENLKGKITVLAIAHRLSTIINSDRVLVLEKGKIKEQGSPQRLLKDKNSYFYKVYNIRK